MRTYSFFTLSLITSVILSQISGKIQLVGRSETTNIQAIGIMHVNKSNSKQKMLLPIRKT